VDVHPGRRRYRPDRKGLRPVGAACPEKMRRSLAPSLSMAAMPHRQGSGPRDQGSTAALSGPNAAVEKVGTEPGARPSGRATKIGG
jgi:hypothetical protein